MNVFISPVTPHQYSGDAQYQQVSIFNQGAVSVMSFRKEHSDICRHW